MRWLVFVAACAAPPKTKPAPLVRDLSPNAWIDRCGDHIEVARIAIARVDPLFVEGELRIDASVFNPRVRYTTKMQHGGIYEALVEQGEPACLDFSREQIDYQWITSNNDAGDFVGNRRYGGEHASIFADRRAPGPTRDVFSREMRRALDACLVDGTRVKLGDVPADISCLDGVDKCPDAPDGNGEDGCPSQ